MSPFIKFCTILVLCTVTLLILVNVMERNYGNEGYTQRLKSMEGYSAKNNERILLNLDNFEYIIRPVCNSTLLTWIVTSYAGDVAPRSALRRAYPKEELREMGITRVFLLGLLNVEAQRKSGVIQAALRDESDRFGDIVQGNFYEAYRNLTYKHLMGLKWATEHCSNAIYIMKQDDDIVLNLYDIVKRIELFGAKDEIFAGYVLKRMKPVREPANKWFVTENEFDGDVYPDFLSGWLYIVSSDIAKKLVVRSEICRKYFWIDDVLLTGIIRHELNIGLTDIRAIYTTDYRYLNCCIRGRDRKLNCEYSIGPNGGRVELQVDFRDFAAFCKNQCKSRPNELSVGKTCVAGNEETKLQMGSARIESIKIV